MYGISNTDNELDEYESDKNPVTAYAEAKWLAEKELNQLSMINQLFHLDLPQSLELVQD